MGAAGGQRDWGAPRHQARLLWPPRHPAVGCCCSPCVPSLPSASTSRQLRHAELGAATGHHLPHFIANGSPPCPLVRISQTPVALSLSHSHLPTCPPNTAGSPSPPTAAAATRSQQWIFSSSPIPTWAWTSSIGFRWLPARGCRRRGRRRGARGARSRQRRARSVGPGYFHPFSYEHAMCPTFCQQCFELG